MALIKPVVLNHARCHYPADSKRLGTFWQSSRQQDSGSWWSRVTEMASAQDNEIGESIMTIGLVNQHGISFDRARGCWDQSAWQILVNKSRGNHTVLTDAQPL
jgi:hypothetical protein